MWRDFYSVPPSWGQAAFDFSTWIGGIKPIKKVKKPQSYAKPSKSDEAPYVYCKYKANIPYVNYYSQ